MITAEKYPLYASFARPIAFLQRDARHFQLVYLSLFLVYGVWALGWDAEIPNWATCIAACLGTQALLIHFTGGRWTSLKSAMISALGLCLMLKTNTLMTCALAGGITIAGKYLIRVDRKHIFNPNNLGIIMAIVLTGDAWVSPGQWGSSVTALYFMGAAALIVLLKVGRIDTSLMFMLSYLGLEFIRTVLYLGWPVDHFFHLVTNGTVLLFTFFMITDPVTTPNAPRARLIWAALIGIMTFVLTHVFYLQSAAPIWALFIIAPLTVVFDKIFAGRRFSWGTEQRIKNQDSRI